MICLGQKYWRNC